MLNSIAAARPLAVLFLAALAASAYDFTALKPQGYVSDFSRVVDPQSKATLENWCARVKEATGAEIALVTIPTLHGEPIEDVANALFRAWGIGQKNENNGILLLLATQDRRSRLEVGYGLEPILPDGFSGALLRQMRPALRESHYGDALILAARTIGVTIAQAKGVTISEAPSPRQPRPQEGFPWQSILPLVIFAFLLWGFGPSRGFRGAGPVFLPLPFPMAGGRRHGGWGSSHGGFGGYDSGGGFGGFGGGDSGGGGASSDW